MQYQETLNSAESFFKIDGVLEEIPFNEASLEKEGVLCIIKSEPKISRDLQKVLEKQKKYLFDLVGIAVAYIQKKYSQNPQAIYDVFEEVLNHLPLMGPSKFTKQSYSYEVESPNALINLQGNRQGEPLFILIEIDAMQVGSMIELVPKIKAFYISLSHSQEKFLEKLISAFLTNEATTVPFEYYSCTSVFNYKALEKKDVKEKFEKFLQETPKIDVTTWNNYLTCDSTKPSR